MANCPSCGSSHIVLKQETNVNWGRTAAGWALFGVVGGAIGAVTGEDRTVNACLDCGTSWKATSLHKILQVINRTTGKTLDLTKESNRLYLNGFIDEISPHLESFAEIEKKSEKVISEAQKKSSESIAAGCTGGCTFSLLLLFGAAGSSLMAGFWGVAMFLLAPFLGAWIGWYVDKANKPKIEANKRKAMREAEQLRHKAKENINLKIAKFEENRRL